MEKKISCFNKVEVCGYVYNFEIKTFPSGVKLANIAIKDSLTDNMTYVTMFNRDTIKYGDTETNLEGLRKIFMAGEKESRNVLVKCTGRIAETKAVGTDGTEKTYTNTTVYKIEPCTDESKQCALLTVTGVVDNIKFNMNDGDELTAKLKLGMINHNMDKNIRSIDYVTVVAHGDMADKLESLDTGKHSVVSLKCDMINKPAPKDRFGDKIGNPIKEIAVARVTYVNTEDDIDENDLDNYKKAKTLKKGEFLDVKTGKIVDPKKTSDNISDDEVDF